MAQCDRLLKFVKMLCLCSLLLGLPVAAARAQVMVPEAPPSNAKTMDFRDSHYGVRFRVPTGWTITRKDGEVSTFRLDARTASPKTQMRSVLAIGFNPYPYSTFSGARVYYSVERHSSDRECAKQATGPPIRTEDTQDIGGMNFLHGHDEHGQICVEARDEVYTAYRKGSCYRFDLAMNTFCSVSSGAQDLTDTQVLQIDQRMADILSTVQLDWSKSGPHPVPVPRLPSEEPLPNGRTPLPSTVTGAQ